MKPESFIVNDDDSSILQEGGGVGDDSEWRADQHVVGLSSFSSSIQSAAPPVPIQEQLKASLVVAMNLATQLAQSHEAPPDAPLAYHGNLRIANLSMVRGMATHVVSFKHVWPNMKACMAIEQLAPLC